jgi:hypothetical protein
MADRAETGETGEKFGSFEEGFHALSTKLAGAYSVPNEIYEQEASISRFEKGVSINSAEPFLNSVKYNKDKAEDIITEFAKSHTVSPYFGKDTPIDIGLKVGSYELLSLGPRDKAAGRSRTIAALAQRAARLEALLDPKNGIPEPYTLAQGQTEKALKLVEKAASLAYNWNTSWGTLNVDNTLNKAMGPDVSRKKVAQAAMVGVLALVGCSNLPNPMDPVSTYNAYRQGTPTATEVVPEVTKTATPTIEVTPTVTPTEAPVLAPIRPDNSDNLYTKEQFDEIKGNNFIDREKALTDWAEYVWTQGENAVFPPGTTQLHFRYLFDPHRDNRGGVCLESESIPGFCMGLPTDSEGNPLPTPTSKITTSTIPPEYQPAVYDLTLDAESAKQVDPVNWEKLEGSTLGWRYNQWVRFKDGAVIATLSKEGAWILADSETLNKLEIIENINDYLEGDDIYSDEYLANKIFIYGPAAFKATNELGLFSVAPELAIVQGIVLGRVKGDNCVWVFLGTKMGEDGKNAVIPLKIPFEQIEHHSAQVAILFFNGRGLAGDMPVDHLDDKQMNLTNQEDAFEGIEKLINKPVLLDFWYPYPGMEDEARRYVLAHGGTEDDVQFVYHFYADEYKTQANSFCSFHPIKDNLIVGNPALNVNCGTGYQGVSITSEVQGFDKSWLSGDNYLSTTVLYSYIIENK